jgi:hypothetical protein
MSIVYPDGIDSFTTKLDYIDIVQNEDVNYLQDAVVAIEMELGTNPKGSSASVRERLDKTLTTANTGITLPNVSGQSGKYLKTDGSALSWGEVLQPCATANGTYAVYNDGVSAGQVTGFTVTNGLITAVTTISG